MAGIFNTDDKTIPKRMKIALIASAVFHIGVVVLGTVGLPHLSKPKIISQPIAVEIVNAADITTTNKPPTKNQRKPVVEPKEPPKTEKKVEAPPKVDVKEPPKVKPLEKKVEKKKDTVKPKPKTPPPPSEKLEKPKEPEKKIEDKEEAIQQEDPLASLMKNLQESEESTEGENTEKVEVESAIDAPFSEYMTQSELSSLTNQLIGCWNIPIGAKEVQGMVVEIHIWANPDRTVKRVEIQDQWRMANDPAFRALAESARSAVLNPRCSPLDIPLEKIKVWKDQYISVPFDPSYVT